MTTSIHQLEFSGSVLQRGFWLYIWEVKPPEALPLYYVGRTGDSSSTKAQSPFNRMGQHLGFAKNSNMLRKYLDVEKIIPEACTFRLVAVGPLEQQSESPGRSEHDGRRDAVAAMEKALAESMSKAGYKVMNRVSSKKKLDATRFEAVLDTFAKSFPKLLVGRHLQAAGT